MIIKSKLEDFVRRTFPEGKISQKITGNEYRTTCPFCKGGDSREVSFDINLDSGVARCWRASCGYRASAAWMVKELLEIPYPQALEIVGGQVSDDDIISSLILATEENHHGIITRRFDPIEAWEESFVKINSIEDYPEIFNWITSRDYCPYKFEEQHDLYYPEQEGRFYGRVIFKISTLDSWAYLGYRFKQIVEPKTMNPKGVRLSEMLYNYNEARSGRALFVCEGIFDTARLKSWGYSAVSIFGSSVSERQNYLLSRVKSDEIIFCMDNGTLEKSMAFANSLANVCRNKRISVMDLKREGSDPDSIGEEEFIEYYNDRKIVSINEYDLMRVFIER
jgi:DNA primase